MAASKKKTKKKTSKSSKKKVAKKASKSSKKVTKKKSAAKKTSKKAAKKTAKKKATPKTSKSSKKKTAKKVSKSSKKVTKKKSAAKKASPTNKTTQAKKQKKSKKNNPKNITETLTKEVEKQKPKASEVLLTDGEGRVLCRFTGCDSPAVVESYCRYHYLLNWKKIQLRKKILAEGKLNKYINELTARYPDKYVEMIKSDLKSEKDFLAAVAELEIDDPDAAMSDADAENFIEEVRGIRGDGGRGGGASNDDY